MPAPKDPKKYKLWRKRLTLAQNSLTTKAKNRLSHLGKKAWNKGLTKKSDSRVAKYGQTLSKVKKGIPNLKLRGDNNPAKRLEVRKKMSESQKKRLKIQSVWNKGIKAPQITKGLLGKPKPTLQGKPTWNKGKKCPQISKTLIERGSHKLERNSNWRGGIDFEPYGLDFNRYLKDKIRKRDNFTCQLCGERENGKKLISHHIDYAKRNNQEKNLILLCNSCHSQTNFNRNFWQKVCKYLINIKIE